LERKYSIAKNSPQSCNNDVLTDCITVTGIKSGALLPY